MRTFDPSTYRKTVLAPYREGGTPNAFERYLLDLDDHDDDAIDDRLTKVRDYWRNNATEGGVVGQLIAKLLKEHNAMVAVLGDPATRAQAAATSREETSRAEAAKWTRVDKALQGVYESDGGIPDSCRPEIHGIGRLSGLGIEEVDEHIDEVMQSKGWHVVESQTRIEPLDKGAADRIIQQLRRLVDTAPPDFVGQPQSLFDVFEAVTFECDGARCRAAITEYEQNLANTVKRDSDHAAAGRNVIESAKLHLVDDAARERYKVTLVLAATDALEGDFAVAAIDRVITADEDAELVIEAAKRGLPDRYARQAVDELFNRASAQQKPISRQVGEAISLALCVGCRTPNQLRDAHAVCLHCGESLTRTCTSCQATVMRGEPTCPQCQTSLVALERAEAEVRAGRAALDAALPAEAVRRAASAVALDASSASARKLHAAATAVVAQAESQWAVVQAAYEDQRLYAARDGLRPLTRIACDVDGPTGTTPSDLFARVITQLEGIELRLKQAGRHTDSAVRERVYAEVLAQVRDCEEAAGTLQRVPPSPPSDVRAVIREEQVEVNWRPSSSPGVEQYVVVRGADSAPTTQSSGMRVAEARETYAVDRAVTAGEQVHYSVFAVRAGTSSLHAPSPPVLLALEAADVGASVGSEEVRLSWRLPGSGARIEIVRTGPDGTRRLEAPRAGFVDRDVVNGQTYDYLVKLVYPTGATDGVHVTATPADAPRPVTIASINAAADGARLRWNAPPTGVVVICRSTVQLAHDSGAEVRRNELDQLGQLLNGDAGMAIDPSPQEGCWYTPFTVSGDRAVAGAGRRWIDLPAMADVRLDDVGAGLRASWSWPDGIKQAVISWREGAPPDGVDDPAATQATVLRALQQDVHGGTFRIDRMHGDEALHVLVVAAQMRDGDLIVGARLGSGSRATAGPAQQRNPIRYEVQVVKKAFRGSHLGFRLLGTEQLPEVVLVVKQGDLLPLNAADGEQVACIGGNGAPGSVTLAIDALPKTRPLAMRAFLSADSARTRWQLKEPADLTSLVLR